MKSSSRLLWIVLFAKLFVIEVLLWALAIRVL